MAAIKRRGNHRRDAEDAEKKERERIESDVFSCGKGNEMEDNPHAELTRAVIAAAIEVHKGLGPGLLESAYQVCLADEFERRGIGYEIEFPIPVEFKGRRLNAGYRSDFLVEESVIVELKSVERLLPIHEALLITYLKLTGKQAALMINFNVPKLIDGIMRRVHTR